jgi:hypothetical protein
MDVEKGEREGYRIKNAHAVAFVHPRLARGRKLRRKFGEHGGNRGGDLMFVPSTSHRKYFYDREPRTLIAPDASALRKLYERAYEELHPPTPPRALRVTVFDDKHVRFVPLDEIADEADMARVLVVFGGLPAPIDQLKAPFDNGKPTAPRGRINGEHAERIMSGLVHGRWRLFDAAMIASSSWSLRAVMRSGFLCLSREAKRAARLIVLRSISWKSPANSSRAGVPKMSSYANTV